MEQTQTNDYLERESLGRLMRKYAIPCVVSLLVAALYNIVDQIFIANANYLGSYGNAANTVVFPLRSIRLPGQSPAPSSTALRKLRKQTI